jgi:hypothetical protein
MDIRGFLAALFTAIARDRAGPGEVTGEEGDARKFLQRSGFFKPDPREASKSLEADVVRALFGLLGSKRWRYRDLSLRDGRAHCRLLPPSSLRIERI